ncbi:MAG TPA: hypothetical protein VFI31_05310 [Pirellulales bacterium]|nr:hypothetical protein [Pirellulales bacterium]
MFGDSRSFRLGDLSKASVDARGRVCGSMRGKLSLISVSSGWRFRSTTSRTLIHVSRLRRERPAETESQTVCQYCQILHAIGGSLRNLLRKFPDPTSVVHVS